MRAVTNNINPPFLVQGSTLLFVPQPAQHEHSTWVSHAGKRDIAEDAVESGRAAESELKVLLLACAIGILTGAGVVLFNDVIKAIRHVAWQVRICASWSCLPSCWDAKPLDPQRE